MGLISCPPQWTRRLFEYVCGEAIFRFLRSERADKTVYITFDDGPVPEVTPNVLECLDKYDVRATFFMVGDNAARYPELVKEVLRRGHSIGNHTMHHVSGLKYNAKDYMQDVMQAARHIPSRLFRPPYGLMRPSQFRRLSNHYKIILFDVVTRDYASNMTSDKIIANVKRYARPGSIIVFHDSIKAWPSLQSALPSAIEWLKKEGYSFETLPASGLF